MALWNRTRALAGVAALALLAGAGAAGAQTTAPTAQASAVYDFDVPAGPLDQAAIRFSEQAGVQLLFDSAAGQGVSARPVHGRLSAAQALDQLLAGTGLTWRFLANGTVTIERPVPGAHMLGAVQVEGVTQQGFPALNGFGAGAGANGSSDPTATEGTGSLTTNGATVASKTPQSLKDTPQSVTVITQERIQQQNLTDLTSAMNYTPGITLQQSDSLYNGLYSRGFQITSFQVDGGAPLDITVYSGNPNLAEYDNVQVLRGSDALFGGASQPGGVVSLDRKRPLNHEQFLGEVDAGSWNNYLVQADVTGPIAFDGHLRARLVVNDQDRDFFYESAHQNKAFVYGVIEGDLDPNTILRAGFSYAQEYDRGWDWNGLPRYSDGADLGLPRSTNLSPPGTRWNFSTSEFFAALEHKFNADWNAKLNFSRVHQSWDHLTTNDGGSIYQNSPINSDYGESSIERRINEETDYALDATLNGAFIVFGLKQSITVGLDYSIGNASQILDEESISVPINVFSFDPSTLSLSGTGVTPYLGVPKNQEEQWGGYATLNIQPIQNFHLIGGVRLSSWWSDYFVQAYFGSPTPLASERVQNGTSGILTPYAAATYGLTPDLTVYASYADIYQVQGDDKDQYGRSLPPVTGVTYETGIKGAFNDNKLNASLSVYYTDESNQAVPNPDQSKCQIGVYCYVNEGAVVSSGIDLEVTGQLLPGWQIQAGYTYNVNRYNTAFLTAQYGNGLNSTYTTQQPNHQIKVWTTYTPTGRFNRWTVGGGLRLESARYSAGSVCTVPTDFSGYCAEGTTHYAFTQDLYAVVDLRVAYKFDEHWQAALNLTNVGDTRYYATVGTSDGSNFYGEPRAFMFSIRAAY